MQLFKKIVFPSPRLLATALLVVGLSLMPLVSSQLVTTLGVHEGSKVIELPPDRFKASPEIGKAWTIDISELDLSGYADNSLDHPNESPVLMFQAGRVLRSHTSHDEIRNSCHCCFSHWGNQLLFSTCDDAAPGVELLTLVIPYTEPLLSNSVVQQSELILWVIVLISAVIAAFFSKDRLNHSCSRSSRILFSVVVFVGLFFHFRFVRATVGGLPSDWHVFYIAPDSTSYLIPYERQGMYTGRAFERPYIYPAFIQLLSRGEIDEPRLFDYPRNQPIETEPNSPLLRIVRAQKVLLILSCSALTWMLSFGIPAPLAALFVTFLGTQGYLSQQASFLLSEPLAQALMLLIVGAAYGFLARGKSAYLIMLAGLCALLFHTRLAGIYALVFFIGCAAWSIRERRTKYRVPFFLLLFLLAVLMGPGRYQRYWGHVPSNYAASLSMAFALQVAAPEDEKVMPDEESRSFFAAAIQNKSIEDKTILLHLPPTEAPYAFRFISSNLYKVIIPTVEELKLTTADAKRICGKISGILLRKHWLRYLRLVAESFSFSIDEVQRLQWKPYIPFWALALGLMVLAAFRYDTNGATAGLCVLAHLTHMLLVAAFDVPTVTRYIYATEPLILLAIFLVCVPQYRNPGKMPP